LTKVLVTGCGGNIGMDVIRSLKQTNHEVIGCDMDSHNLHFGRKLLKRVYNVPGASEPGYADAVNEICRKEKVELMFVNPDVEIEFVAMNREKFDAKVFMVGREYAEKCMDKRLTFEFLKDMAEFPKTVEIGSEKGLEEAFMSMKPRLWMRAAVGAGGRGSIIVNDIIHALRWMEYWGEKKWKWILQEYLPGRNFNWTSLVLDGEVVTSGAMERLGYLMEHVSVSGVTGNVRLAKTIHDRRLNEIGEKVCSKFKNSSGIVSIDLKEDEQEIPNITEVGIRFAGRPWLYACAGANFASAVVDIYDGKQVKMPKFNAPEAGILEVRQVDIEPVIVKEGEAK
jgi:carbamoylphosphate synthase large subunit